MNYTVNRQARDATYAEPHFDELLELCLDFGLVSASAVSRRGVILYCVNEVFDVTLAEARILLKGLILGFFYGHNQDDLGLAAWRP